MQYENICAFFGNKITNTANTSRILLSTFNIKGND